MVDAMEQLGATLREINFENLKYLYSALKLKTNGGRPKNKAAIIAAISMPPYEGIEKSKTAIKNHGRNIGIVGTDNAVKLALLKAGKLEFVYQVSPHTEEEWIVTVNNTIRKNLLAIKTAPELLRLLNAPNSNSAEEANVPSVPTVPDATNTGTQTEPVEEHLIKCYTLQTTIQAAIVSINQYFSMTIQLQSLQQIKRLINQSLDNVDTIRNIVAVSGSSHKFESYCEQAMQKLETLNTKFNKKEQFDKSTLEDIDDILQEAHYYNHLYGDEIPENVDKIIQDLKILREDDDSGTSSSTTRKRKIDHDDSMMTPKKIAKKH